MEVVEKTHPRIFSAFATSRPPADDAEVQLQLRRLRLCRYNWKGKSVSSASNPRNLLLLPPIRPLACRSKSQLWCSLRSYR